MLKLISSDFDILPSQILPAAKEHLRVEFDRDDQYIKGAIARAIAEIESVTDLTINSSQWQWQPTSCYTTRYIRIPKIPVRQLLDSDLQEVEIIWNDPIGYIEGSKIGNRFTIVAGYADIKQLPPAVMNAILMLTGTLYEQREAVQAGSFNELPDMANRLMAGLWRPSC